MAERFMRDLLRRSGIETIQVESAGVFAVEGMFPTKETERVLRSVGIDGSDHRARPLTAEMVHHADLVLVMEQFHKEEVVRRAPNAREKVHVLKSYGVSPQEAPSMTNIPDPIGKPLEVYEVCFADIREAVERVVKSLGVNRA